MPKQKMNRKPLVIVTRKLPDVIETRLMELFDTQLNLDDKPMSQAELVEAVQKADVLVPTVTDRIDAGVLSQAGEKLRLIASFGTGVDHIDLGTARNRGITITNTPDRMPPAEGLVRVPDFGGFWNLQPAGTGAVKVTYRVHGDPGGWVPIWIANYAAARSVIRTLENLPAAAERYRDARSDHVRELTAR